MASSKGALCPCRWGLAGSILALETLKRAMAPINRARDIIVGQAVQAGMVSLLLGQLDWRKADAGSSRGEEEVCCPILRRLLDPNTALCVISCSG